MLTVCGIDVGGSRRGFHAVALTTPGAPANPRNLTAAQIERAHDVDPEHIVNWCNQRNASAIGFDASCGWSAAERSRACERELHHQGIHCFFTPARESCVGNGFYQWVFNGELLCQALTRRFPLYQGGGIPNQPFSFETFSHAVARTLDHGPNSEETKSARRRRLLQEHGLDLTLLTNVDLRDGALCALTALYMLDGHFTPYGDRREGVLVVPKPI